MEQHPSMNRIYRIVWSQTSQAWVVMAENSHRQGKRSSRGLLTAALSLSAAWRLQVRPEDRSLQRLRTSAGRSGYQ